jgi:hypothetical protein
MFPRMTLILAFLLVGSVVRAEDPPPVVAVFEIENRGSPLSKDELTALTDYLGTKLVEQKKASFKACYDQSCQIEVGREMAAQFTVSASISKVGNTCIITSAMYDLKKAATYKTGTAKGPCTADDLLTAVEQIASKLEGGVAGAGTTPEPPPPAAQKPPDVIRAPPRKLRKRTKSILAAALWSLLPGGGMYYVDKWGWGIFYTTTILGGMVMFYAFAFSDGIPEWSAAGGAVFGISWAVSIIHSMVAASNWQDPDAETAGLDRGFRPVPAIAPGRDPHPAVFFQVLSVRF